MVKSRSGVLRQSVGPAKARLNVNVEAAEALIGAALPVDNDGWQGLTDDLTELAAKISSGIKTISEKDEKWQAIISELEEEDVDREEQLYQTSALDPAEGYLHILESAKDMMCRLDRKSTEAKRMVAQTTATAEPAARDTSRGKGMRPTANLPKLSLPTFGGDHMEWDNFWSIYSTSVHKQEMAPAENFSYLRGQLKGSALNAIDGIAVNDDNYEIAISILRERFKRDPGQQVGTLYSQLKRLPAATNQVPSLLCTYDACEKIFRQLETIGEDTDGNRSLVLDVLSKYPSAVVRDLMRHQTVGTQSSLSEVRNALKLHIKQSESMVELFDDLDPFGSDTVSAARSSRQKLDSANKARPGRYDDDASSMRCASNGVEGAASKQTTPTSALAAADKRVIPSQKLTPQSPCYFCAKKHFNAECPEYKTAAQRLARLRELGRCGRCLVGMHNEVACRMPPGQVWCFFCRTSGDHRTPVCQTRFANAPRSKDEHVLICHDTTGLSGDGADKIAEAGLLSVSEQAVLLTATVNARNPTTGATTRLRMLFDTGSHRSYVTTRGAGMLGLESLGHEHIHLSVFGTKRTTLVSTDRVSFGIVQRDGTVKSINANTTRVITECPIVVGKMSVDDAEMIESLKDALADDVDSLEGSVDVLIGTDYFWEFITGTPVTTPSGLNLIPSTVGLLLGGRYQDDGSEAMKVEPVLLCLTETSSVIPIVSGLLATSNGGSTASCPDIDEFWSLETIGINDSPTVNDDDEADRQFSATVQFVDGRYHVQFPKKPIIHKLPTNKPLALGRFSSMAKRLRTANPEVLQKYQEVIDDQLTKGVIERVPDDEVVNDGARAGRILHYLPHHPVVKPNSATTKVRIVYDASAKIRKDNPSLNECLYRGPILLPDLCSILIRFRLHEIALVADVEKAFLQMCLQSEDRDMTRFFWFKDPANPAVENNWIILRFARVPFGIICSPFLLAAVISYHLRKSNDWVSLRIEPNTYVDNVITGAEDTDRARQFYDKAKSVFSSAGMNLQQWCSNSDDILDYIPVEDRTKQRKMSVLGMQWDSANDTLQLNRGKSWGSHKFTKRGILQAIASIYDPLGLYQPVLLRAKQFLQELWENKKGWDDSIDAVAEDEAKQILDDIAPVFDMPVPRHLREPRGNAGDCGLVAFSDASIIAYAAAVYLRVWDGQREQWTSDLVFSKSRMAPKQRGSRVITLPRLELLGAAIGGRAAVFVRNALQMPGPIKITLFSDSTCVLSWLRSPKPLSVFVQNRINELKKIEHCEFKYVNTSENPADYGTRGKLPGELRGSALWWHGPTWLCKDTDKWPQSVEIPPQVSDESMEEIRKSCPVYHTLLVGEGEVELQDDVVPPLGIDPTRHSSFRGLLRTTIWCLKFIKLKVWNHLSEDQRQSMGAIDPLFRDITDERRIACTEMGRAKMMWIKHVQQMHYGDVKKCLSTGKQHMLIKQLGLNVDDNGIIRCYGRFEYADLPTEAVQPKLLAKNDHTTNIIIREMHERLIHSGVGHTLSQLRREYWIPNGRKTVRKVLTRCVFCRKHKGPPFALPRMPPWPRERLSRSSPFQFTGLDYLGPINVQIGDGTHKMWVCLFTCLATRAIHLECVSDCSAKEFLQCVIRFVARRGTPAQIISDNAPQFRVTKLVFDRLWHAVLTDDSVHSYAAKEHIDWKFTTELAPWQGGFYERLVGIVKRAFKVAIGRRLLQWGEFVTLSTEVEAIVNSRPITYLYGDFQSGLALRPIDFLTDRAAGMPVTRPELRPNELGEAGRDLVRYWKFKQGRLNSLWQFWYDEYLMSLRERGQTTHRNRRGAITGSPQVGDVVLVKDGDIPRGCWKLAKVVRLIWSNDNEVRSAEVRLPNGYTIRRSVSHLYPLELGSSPPDDDDTLHRGNEGEANAGDEGSVDETLGAAGDAAVEGKQVGATGTDVNGADETVIGGLVNGMGDAGIVDNDFHGFTALEFEEARRRVESLHGKDSVHEAAMTIIGTGLAAVGVTWSA